MKRLPLAEIFRVTLLAIVVSGCALPQYNYMPAIIELSEPPIGSVNKVYVGDSLLRQGNYTEYDAIYLESDTKAGIINEYTIQKGYYLKKGADKNYEFYLPSDGEDGGGIWKMEIADNWECVQAYRNENKLCVVTVYHQSDCAKDVPFRRVKKAIYTSNSFQQTLIYSGKVGTKINIGYREFSKNLARPAFNNDVEYDLGESKVIGYKGAKLEIIEANNEFIKYKVLRNFNKAKY